MISTSSQQSWTGGRLTALALTLAAPFMAYVIVKAAAASASPAAALAMAKLPPADPAPLLRQLRLLAQNPKARVSAAVVSQTRQTFTNAPLAFEPFYIVARSEEQAGRLARATALMEEARFRRRSHPAVRMQLMAYYSQAQRYSQAMAEMDWLLRRDPQLRIPLMPALTKLIADPQGRAALADLLARDPVWRVEFFAIAGQSKIPPAQARDLLARIAQRKGGRKLDLERQFLLQTQVTNGEYQSARATALGGLPAASRAANALLADGSFSGTPIPQPFGWKLHDSDVGRAEPVRSDGRPYLDVSFFGGRDVVLAEQVLALAPGKYQLRTVVRADGAAPEARVYWKIDCLPAQTTIVSLDIAAAGSDFGRMRKDLVVPANGCTGQRLSLVAEAGEVAKPMNLQIAQVELGR